MDIPDHGKHALGGTTAMKERVKWCWKGER